MNASGAGVFGFDSEGLSDGEGWTRGSGGTDAVEVDDFERDCFRARGAGEPKFASLSDGMLRTMILVLICTFDEFFDEAAAGVLREGVDGAMVDDYLMDGGGGVVVRKKGGGVDG